MPPGAALGASRHFSAMLTVPFVSHPWRFSAIWTNFAIVVEAPASEMGVSHTCDAGPSLGYSINVQDTYFYSDSYLYISVKKKGFCHSW